MLGVAVHTMSCHVGKKRSCTSTTFLVSEQILALEAQVVRKVGCGAAHNVVLTDNGQLFSWGDNLHSQLGCGFTDEQFLKKPR